MEIKVLTKNLNGEARYSGEPSINWLELSSDDYAEHEVYKLSNGSILQEPNKKCRTFKCDFSGGEDNWNGYILGYLYDDGKFIGKYHPLAHSEDSIEAMDGIYIESKAGIVIQGKYYIDNQLEGSFFYKIGEWKFKNVTKSASSTAIATASRVKAPDLFSKDLYKALLSKSSKIKLKHTGREYDHYSHIVRLDLKPTDSDQVVLAISVAYSWMPTMLHLYIGKEYKMKEVLEAVVFIGKIKTYNDFIKNNDKLIDALMLLTNCINHSIVGVSKTLHIFYPECVPMIDSNALKGWDKFFRKYYKKHPDLKLNKTIPLKIPNQVVLFMSYWEFLLIWSRDAGIKNIRLLEEPFYWLGKGH